MQRRGVVGGVREKDQRVCARGVANKARAEEGRGGTELSESLVGFRDLRR